MVGDNAGWYGPWPDLGDPLPGRLLTFPRDTCQWENAVANVGLRCYGQHVDNNMGPEMCFGRTLLDANISSRVGFVPVALGGSVLARDWAPSMNLMHQLTNMTRVAMQAAGAGARLRGMLFIEGEGSAMDLYNSPENPIAHTWADTFRSMVLQIRSDLAYLNPCLPVVMAVQRIADRNRVFPLIDVVKAQQQAVDMPNVFKADMEFWEMYPVDFTEIYGAEVGLQSIHFTASGSCDMGIALAQSFIGASDNGKVMECTPSPPPPPPPPLW
ncbi:hypothetical protein FOA52_001206 [Chlamydomonas sp. UWO 241]|nr:hypothetical protein FOA52_001206 [Chlamydomonas sp. UWO 241]